MTRYPDAAAGPYRRRTPFDGVQAAAGTVAQRYLPGRPGSKVEAKPLAAHGRVRGKDPLATRGWPAASPWERGTGHGQNARFGPWLAPTGSYGRIGVRNAGPNPPKGPLGRRHTPLGSGKQYPGGNTRGAPGQLVAPFVLGAHRDPLGTGTHPRPGTREDTQGGHTGTRQSRSRRATETFGGPTRGITGTRGSGTQGGATRGQSLPGQERGHTRIPLPRQGGGHPRVRRPAGQRLGIRGHKGGAPRGNLRIWPPGSRGTRGGGTRGDKPLLSTTGGGDRAPAHEHPTFGWTKSGGKCGPLLGPTKTRATREGVRPHTDGGDHTNRGGYDTPLGGREKYGWGAPTRRV